MLWISNEGVGVVIFGEVAKGRRVEMIAALAQNAKAHDLTNPGRSLTRYCNNSCCMTLTYMATACLYSHYTKRSSA